MITWIRRWWRRQQFIATLPRCQSELVTMGWPGQEQDVEICYRCDFAPATCLSDEFDQRLAEYDKQVAQ